MKYLLRHTLYRAIQQQRAKSTNQQLKKKMRHDLWKAHKRHNVPKSVAAIPDRGTTTNNAGAFIRSLGSMRRIFLLKPFLTLRELEGLSYRIKTLTKSAACSSVLIATDQTDDNEMGALFSIDVDLLRTELGEDLDGYELGDNTKTFHVAGGYDPQQLYESSHYKNPDYVNRLLTNLTALASACKGSHRTKLPTVFLPHGAVTDGGFGFLLSSYVLSTPESCFRILNPSRGLSLDPVGLSYFLPRLGQEFNQQSAKFRGCGLILGLMGYEADQMDMLACGLSTHRLDNALVLGDLEQMLSSIQPWESQAILKQPVRDYGQEKPTHDSNHMFRNVAVASAIDALADDCVYGPDILNQAGPEAEWIVEDPSFYTDHAPYTQDSVTRLVTYAETFDEIFCQNGTLSGLLESFREVSQRTTDDPEIQEGIDVAKDFVQRLEKQCPLAVSVVFELLKKSANNPRDTLAACVEREKRAQLNMFSQPDFASWGAATKANRNESVVWKHKSIADVSHDEVLEILGKEEEPKQ